MCLPSKVHILCGVMYVVKNAKLRYTARASRTCVRKSPASLANERVMKREITKYTMRLLLCECDKQDGGKGEIRV